MDSSGTKTSVRVTSGGGGGVSMCTGDISRRVAPTHGWQLRTGSVEKARMGAGVRLEPDLLWRSLRVGLICCLSLKPEEWTFAALWRDTHLNQLFLSHWAKTSHDSFQLLDDVRIINTIWPAAPLEAETAAADFSQGGPVHQELSSPTWNQTKWAERGWGGQDSGGGWVLLGYLRLCCQRTGAESVCVYVSGWWI